MKKKTNSARELKTTLCARFITGECAWVGNISYAYKNIRILLKVIALFPKRLKRALGFFNSKQIIEIIRSKSMVVHI